MHGKQMKALLINALFSILSDLCVCVCVCACALACVRACVHVFSNLSGRVWPSNGNPPLGCQMGLTLASADTDAHYDRRSYCACVCW